MAVQAGAKPVDESHGAHVQGRLVHICRTGAMGLQSLRNHPQKNAQHHVQHCPIALHKVAQPFWHRQHPLAYWQARENMLCQVLRRLHPTPGGARGAHTPAFAGIGDEVVVPAVTTADTGKAVRKDAAFQIFGKRLADIGLWRVVVTLPVELARTGQIKPSLEMLGCCLVAQRALRVARIVESGFDARLPTRVQLRVRWSGGGWHGAVPAWAGRLMMRCLYPAWYASLLSAGSPINPELIAGCEDSTGTADCSTPQEYLDPNRRLVAWLTYFSGTARPPQIARW
jgi:hypothetical protein